MTWTSEQDFIDSYNHKLSSTFSHPSLPFVYHSENWSACSRIVSLPAVPNALALSPDEALLAVTAGSDVLIYSTEDGMRLTHTLKGHTGWVSQVEWLPGKERKLVSSSTIMGMHDEEIVRFWDLNKEDSLTHVEISTRDAAMGDISGAEPFVLQAGWTNNKVAASEPVFGEKMIEKHISTQEADGDYTNSSGIDLDDVATRATATAADALICKAGWTYEEISATELRQLILDALRKAEAKQSLLRGVAFPGCLAGFNSSSLSPDGNSLFYLPTSSVVAVLSTSTQTETFRLEGHTDGIMWLGASPDGKLLATSSWDCTVKIWDLKDGSLVRTLKGTEGQNWSGSWSPDGKLIAVGSGDQTVRVWDVFSGNTLQVFGENGKMFSGWVRGLAFDPSNGHSLIASSSGGTVRVFNILSAKCTNLYQIDPASSQIASEFMEISDTLKYAPSSSGRFGFKPTDGRLVVYDTGRNEMWEFIQNKEGSARTFGSGTFVFSKDGKRVYSGDTDGAVRVWDLD